MSLTNMLFILIGTAMFSLLLHLDARARRRQRHQIKTYRFGRIE